MTSCRKQPPKHPVSLSPEQQAETTAPRDSMAKHLRILAQEHGRYAAEGQKQGTFTLIPWQYHQDCERKLNHYALAFQQGNEALMAEYEARFPQDVLEGLHP